MNNVYVTAYSTISALGVGNEEAINSLESGKNTIYHPKESDKFKKPSFPAKFNFELNNEITLSSNFVLKLLSLIEDKWIELAPLPIFLATSTGGIKEIEEVYLNLVKTNQKYPLSKKYYFYDLYQSIKEKYGEKITDAYTFATACSSAGHSILHAYRFIKKGIIGKALVLGVDALSITTLFGFDALKLVSQNGTKPLTKERDGLSLGEGGGILLLESKPTYEPIAEIMGVASNSDGYHITAPNPEGTQQKACILNAINQAGISPEDVKYINAHGTGTPTNDEIEVNVIKSIFKPGTMTTSLKGFIGHTVGASAIIELGLIFEMNKKGKIYQQKGLGELIDDSYIPKETINFKSEYFLKNSFGFGGNNVSMVLKNYL